MSRYNDDYRYEQRRLDRIADERRYDQRRIDRIADERRYEQRRQDARAEERRREERRRDDIDADNRRQEREDREKSRKETNELAMSWLRSGNVEAAAATWGLNLGTPAPARVARPTLSASRGSVPGITWLKWTGLAPDGYLLQSAASEAFADPAEFYRGFETEHLELTPETAPRWYRVRCQGLIGEAGAWSDAVRLEALRPERLTAPRLEVAEDFLTGTTTWSWTAVPGATGYLLQQSASPGFLAPVELYKGEMTRYARPRPGLGHFAPLPRWETPGLSFRPALFAGTDFYRVKALGGVTPDSPWSNVA